MTYASTLGLSLSFVAVAWAAPPEQPPTEPDPGELVSRAIHVVEGMLQRLPDYTCQETLERSERAAHASKPRMLDRTRIEVAYVNGEEIYARPGSTRFDESDLRELVSGSGAIGTGAFGEHLTNAYLTGLPLQVAGKDILNGREAWKLTQSVPASLSHFDVIVPPVKVTAGYTVNAWHDAATLELLRFELQADDLPRRLPLRRSFMAIEYAGVLVNGQLIRLPLMTELSMTTRKGVESRTVSTFSSCREYKGESKLIFTEIPVEQTNPLPRPADALLPAGLEVQVQLDAAADLKQAARGDLVTMTVSRDSISNGRKALSAGARVKGRWRFIECHSAPFTYCFAILDPETFEDAANSGPFRASLLLPSLEALLLPPGTGRDLLSRPTFPEGISRAEKEAPILYVPLTTKLPRGYRLVWRTLEVSGGTKP